jgi:hypothetical protein
MENNMHQAEGLRLNGLSFRILLLSGFFSYLLQNGFHINIDFRIVIVLTGTYIKQ